MNYILKYYHMCNYIYFSKKSTFPTKKIKISLYIILLLLSNLKNMEKIIKWKIYNTEKSALITNCWIHNLELNLDELNEILYKTKSWEYFLYTYTCNIINGENKLWENLKIVDIFQIMQWYEKRQQYFDESEKKKFFIEFWRFFLEA